jgi:hypothetical protein
MPGHYQKMRHSIWRVFGSKPEVQFLGIRAGLRVLKSTTAFFGVARLLRRPFRVVKHRLIQGRRGEASFRKSAFEEQ